MIGSVGRDADSSSGPPSVRFTRLLPDGSLDAGFGDGGTLDTGIETYGGLRLGIGSDGRIVIATTAPNPDAGRAFGGAVLIARFHSDGTLDGSFGADGFVTVADPAASSTGEGPLIVEPDGGITIAAGTYEEESFTARTVLFRVSADGDLDESFGSAGFSRLPVSHYISDLERSPSGRLIGVGQAAVEPRGVDYEPRAFRLESTGVLDPSFSGDGIAAIPAAKLGQLSSLVLEPDGSILAAGAGNVTPFDEEGVGGEEGSDFLLVRIKRNGRPDRSFARHGVVLTDVGGNIDRASAIGVQPDGRIVLAGSRANWVYRGPIDEKPTLARYNRGTGRIDSDGDGVLDRSDRCVALPGRHRGCPLRARRLSIELRDGAFTGRLHSAKPRCVKGARILLIRRLAGKAKVVGADRRLKRGRYAVDAPAGAGRYFAKVERDRHRRVGICAAARSKSIIWPRS